MQSSGVRGVSGKSMMDAGEGVPRTMRESRTASMKESLRLAARWDGAADGRLGYAFAPRFILSCSERLLREVATAHPELYDIKYSLGLLLVEEKKYEEAVDFLFQAARGLPQRSRIHYNLGLLLRQLQRDLEAEKALKQALAIEPSQPEYIYALAVFYLQRQQFEKAQQLAEKMIAIPASRSAGERLLTVIEQQRGASSSP